MIAFNVIINNPLADEQDRIGELAELYMLNKPENIENHT